MIAHELEGGSLRKYGRVVIERAVLEAKSQPAGDPVTLSDLSKLTVCEARAIKSAQCQKSVR